ncbi:MAG: helix-turn-helix domain-containing protein, partial [Synechococcaceae bacterium WB5_2A_257]|nr:helix-turn-helix domain-containing protein [Synechococcaceae bacterium WB5_2A_257]
MAASRLNNSQKQELVQRYQAGEASAALAEAFECSTNTVSRTVKAALGIEAYAAL